MSRMLERLWDGPDAGDNQGPAALLAEQATADSLFGPDWGLLMELCDKVNLEVQTHGKDAAKALRKRLEKGTPKGQLLALTALEATVKNCGRRYHEIVAQQEALSAMAKVAANRRSDPEVREKAAALIQDWAEAIRLSPYRDTYAELQSKGVDFPPRDPARLSPIHTPPQTSSLAGINDADAAAIAAAVDEINAEVAGEEAAAYAAAAAAQQAQQRAREAASGGFDFMNARKAERKQLRSTPSDYMALPGSPSEAGSAATGAPVPYFAPLSPGPSYPGGTAMGTPVVDGYGGGGGGSLLSPQRGRAAPRPSPAELVEQASTSTQVLDQLLRCIDPARPGELLGDEVVEQIAQSCRGPLSAQLRELVSTCQDDATLASALSVNDEMQRVLEVFDYLLATALAQRAQSRPPGSAAAAASASVPIPAPPPLPPKPARMEAASPGSVWGGAAAASSGGEDRRVGQLQMARSRGAALLAEDAASVRLPPPPSTGAARRPQPSPGSVASPPPPPSAFDLLSQLETPPPPQSAVAASVASPAGFTNYTNPMSLLDGGGRGLGEATARQAVLSPPPSSVAAAAPPPSVQDVFDSLPPVIVSPGPASVQQPAVVPPHLEGQQAPPPLPAGPVNPFL